MFIWDFLASFVLDQIVDWIYTSVVGFLGDFFALMGQIGAELFDLPWVEAVTMFITSLTVPTMRNIMPRVKNEVYSLIASWVESCGFEIRYKERDAGDNRIAHTLPNEYGQSYIQMYNNEELYIEYGKYLEVSFGNDNFFMRVGAANVLAHELAHQIFTNVSCKPFAKLFGIEPECDANDVMVNNEDACDAFGNFIYTLAERIINNQPPSDELEPVFIK